MVQNEKRKQEVLLFNVSQKRLAGLLGVSRQAIYDWGKIGLPRNEDRTYEMPAVLRWLRQVYKSKISYYARNRKERRKYGRRYYASHREECLAYGNARYAKKKNAEG